MNVANGEFEEISHSGGIVTFTVRTHENGRRVLSVRWESSRPVPAALFAIYALPPGIPVAGITMGGIGTPWNAPPFSNCIPVLISSDSQGLFGQECPRCSGYWRSRSNPRVCPYCGIMEQRHNFLTQAQRRYVEQYCFRLEEALAHEKDGDHTIDMDAVADAAGKEGEKPKFYYAEERQQNQFSCMACEAINDIIGRFGYCCECGTRNDLQELEANTLPALRAKVNAGDDGGTCLRGIASALDSLISQYVKQLIDAVPMIPARRSRLENMRFHNVEAVVGELKETFGIDLVAGLKADDVKHCSLMFHRRHVYEHNGGEADERYLKDSGDVTIRLKQALREDVASLHRFANSVSRIARNLHEGFHQIFPPESGPIQAFQEKKARIASYERRGR